MALISDKLWVAGTTPDFRVSVEASAQLPARQETVQNIQVFNHNQQLAVEAAQRERQQAQGRGFSV